MTDYIIGPPVSFPSTNNVINSELWNEIPEDLQRIILEEAAKSEPEALRLASIQNEMGLLKNTEAGLEFVEFSDEMKFRNLNTAVMEHVVPAWVNLVGYAGHPVISDAFNNKVGPIVGLRIEADGTVVKTN